MLPGNRRGMGFYRRLRNLKVNMLAGNRLCVL